MFLTFKKWVKNIQAVGYNGVRMVLTFEEQNNDLQ